MLTEISKSAILKSFEDLPSASTN